MYDYYYYKYITVKQNLEKSVYQLLTDKTLKFKENQKKTTEWINETQENDYKKKEVVKALPVIQSTLCELFLK